MARRRAPGAAPASILAPKQTEKQWMATVLEWAQIRGWRAYHPWISIRSAAGFPDLVLVRRPVVLFVELKSDTGTVSADQQMWIDELRACGQDVRIWRPSDWPEVERTLL